MVLKKQTVWLLTMLSLIVVLSVYYVTTPSKAPTAASDQSATNSNTKAEATSSITSADDVFATYKIQRDQQTSAEAKKYEQVIAADTSTASQVSEATNQLAALNDQANQEKLLEDEIISKGYGSDAVVTTNGAYAEVYVKATNLSSKQASEIMAMVVNSPLGVQFANVKYQSANS